MFPFSHQHKWKPRFHADGCHFFIWDYQCSECGTRKTTSTERTLQDLYYWVDRVDCERCKELLAGDNPTCHVVIIARDGTVVKDEIKK